MSRLVTVGFNSDQDAMAFLNSIDDVDEYEPKYVLIVTGRTPEGKAKVKALRVKTIFLTRET